MAWRCQYRHAAELHSKRTVGITDPVRRPIVFEDVTDKTALASFKQRTGSPAKNFIFEVPSGGVAIFDYDGDGLAGYLSAERIDRGGAGRERKKLAASCPCITIWATGSSKMLLTTAGARQRTLGDGCGCRRL